MPLSPERALEISDEVAEGIRVLAKEHPASGRLRVLARNLLNGIMWNWIERVARQHMAMSMKARQRGHLNYAVWHCGAASALKDSRKFGKSYAVYAAQLMKE